MEEKRQLENKAGTVMCSLLFLVDLLFFFLCKERNAAVTILFGSFCCCILCLLALASLSFAGWQERHSFCLLAWLAFALFGVKTFLFWEEHCICHATLRNISCV